ncbi:MAG: hypothetical protein FVQ85_20160 [Planctomycetes bacterium]|nr:hypothetical protein [Planctomycetota bacterium]
MAELNGKFENLEKAQEAEVSSGVISRDKLFRKMCRFYRGIRIATIIFLVALILVLIFESEIVGHISIPFFILLVISAVLGRVLAFYMKQLSRLGFATEISFIFGVILVVISSWLETGFLLVGLIISFMVSPLLGIVNRVLLLTRKESKSVGSTIAEMVILGMPVIIVVWILLKVYL